MSGTVELLSRTDADTTTPQPFVPKLRKNKRLDDRWGLRYYLAVKEAVFASRTSPYMPSEPPLPLSEDDGDSQPLYVCKQCRDCFRFLSSLEEHGTRRSWILGYWCQNCFSTDCSHVPSGEPACSACQDLDRQKKCHLRAKGLKKGRKMGCIKIFYNQCQFFNHLKVHRTVTVDMGDVMLMPVPTDIEREHYVELDGACEVLMEHMFLTRTHIMDWLKAKQVGSKWWKLLHLNSGNNENPISEILRVFREKHFRKAGATKLSLRSANAESSTDARKRDASSSVIASKATVAPITSIDPLEPSEDDDDPCVAADIAFVDCGPTARTYRPLAGPDPRPPRSKVEGGRRARANDGVDGASEATSGGQSTSSLVYSVSSDATPWNNDSAFVPKISVRKFANERSASPVVGSLWKNFSREYDRRKQESSSSSSSSSRKTSGRGAIEHRSSPKILTVHSPKNANLSTIISQLPADVVNGKKIVFIEHDAKREAPSGQVTIPGTAESGWAKMMTTKTVPLVASSIANEHGPRSTCATAMQQTLADAVGCKVQQQQQSLDGKIIYQNGRKFIVKHAPRLGSSTTAAALAKPLGAPTKPESTASRAAPVELLPDGIVSPPTPSPSPSEQSSGSSCEAQQQAKAPAGDTESSKVPEYLSIVTDRVTGRCYLAGSDSKPIERGGVTAHWYALAPTYRQRMLDNLLHLNKAQLVKRIDHLRTVNSEYSKMISATSDSVISGNLAAIKRLEDAMVGGALWNNEEYESDDAGVRWEGQEDDDVVVSSIREEETTSSAAAAAAKCARCDRPVKPRSYVVGVTKMPRDVAPTYCSCYNQVCHVCGIFQGNASRLSAHLNYHARQEPFTCPECFRQFTSFKLLDVHVWTSCFHPLVKRWFGCKICQVEGFLDMESVTRHFVIVHSERKVACRTCRVILSSRAALAEHRKAEHPDAASGSSSKAVLELIVCNPGQCVVRPERYRTHMDNHVGIFRMLYYKCPFCLFSAKESERGKERIKSHLYKGHLERLSELIDLESLLDIMSIKQVKRVKAFRDMNFLTYHNAGNALVGTAAAATGPKEKSEIGTMIPRIVSAHTITPEIFADDPSNENEQAACGVWSVDPNNSGLPKILDVRSIASEDAVSSNPNVGRGETLDAPRVTAEGEEEKRQRQILSDTAAAGSNARTNFPRVPLLFEMGDARMSSILRSPPPPPPPLARIPQHLLNASATEAATKQQQQQQQQKKKKKKKKKEEEEEPPRARGSLEQSALRERRGRKSRRPWRIALNGPISRIETSAQARDYRCHLCGELISTAWPVVRSHFSSRHSRDYKLSIVTPRLLRISTEFIEGGYKREAFRSKKRRSDSGAPMPKRRKRWTPRKYVDRTNQLAEVGFYVRQESAQDGEGNFKCKKCNVRCGDMAELREHIAANHRIKGRYLICLECGENFVVAPSLQMHLRALHGITDPITYMTQNTAYAPEMMDDGENEAKATIANQCHVCMAVFEDKAAVDKHLRVHGMAFLNRKRIEARNAIGKRPAEKKAKLDSPDEDGRKDDGGTTETFASFERRARALEESPAQSNDDGRAIDLGQQSTTNQEEVSPSAASLI